jgi:hypothetical protein
MDPTLRMVQKKYSNPVILYIGYSYCYSYYTVTTVQMPAMRRAAVAFYTRGDNIWNQQISIQFEYT